jgi:hypothetical protein
MALPPGFLMQSFIVSLKGFTLQSLAQKILFVLSGILYYRIAWRWFG